MFSLSNCRSQSLGFNCIGLRGDSKSIGFGWTYCRDQIIADPEKYFQELISEKLLIFLRDGPCLELIIASSNFQALLRLQDKLLASV